MNCLFPTFYTIRFHKETVITENELNERYPIFDRSVAFTGGMPDPVETVVLPWFYRCRRRPTWYAGKRLGKE